MKTRDNPYSNEIYFWQKKVLLSFYYFRINTLKGINKMLWEFDLRRISHTVINLIPTLNFNLQTK